jgi:hypothetical protein
MKRKTWSVLSDPIAPKLRAIVACLAKPNHVGRLGVALALCSALETNSLAQNLGFPEPAPDTPARAEEQFAKRANVVIQTNACGREDEYLRIRAEMAQGNLANEGEDFIHILVAKIAYIRAHSNPTVFQPPCTAEISRLPADFAARDQNVAVIKERVPSTEEPCAREDPSAPPNDPDPNTPITVKVSLDTQCMARQVNAAVMAMEKTSKLGSSGVPCIGNVADPILLAQFFTSGPNFGDVVMPEGEWDVNNRELVRLLYLGSPFPGRAGGVLQPSTIEHMYTDLLAARGKLSDGSYPILYDCSEPAGDELGTPEDSADRDAWYKDVADFLGDALEWFGITYLTYGLGPFGAIALIGVPLLLAGTVGSPQDLLGDLKLSIPETENHRLNIETSKFLTNADSIARLKLNNYGTGKLEDEQKEVRDWLMRRLQDIAQNDFQEYNARPYSRYSLNAILNLCDFAKGADDEDLALAARSVLDLSEAKFAATSNRGRRIVPFRRRSNEEGDENRYLYESFSGAEHEIPRAMLLSGQTQLLDPNHPMLGPDGKPVPLAAYRYKLAALAEMVNAATSNYRLPSGALEKAVTRQAFEQTIRHTSVERVEQSPAFTISAGGLTTGPTAKVLVFSSDTDRGDAMPTVIIPTIAGSYMRDLFRFDGAGIHHLRSNNTCVAPGFACGIEPKLSTVFAACTQPEPPEQFFVSSYECFPNLPGPQFYLAGRIFSHAGTEVWGLMDIVEATPPPALPNPTRAAPDEAYIKFKSGRRAALDAVVLDEHSRGTYTTAAGHQIVFGLHEPTELSPSEEEATVVSIDGKPPPPWVTAGGLIDADGAGKATIKGFPRSEKIDFSDPTQPKVTFE